EIMSSYWVNFATTGDPNGKDLPSWPAFDAKAGLVIGFGNKVDVVPLPHKSALDFWEAYFENRRKSQPRQSVQ
ncbi:MAG TPA: carboxylesterase family protein, partial [Candidatus Solibacter sp.]|nr:carboxylesterase family protein [Candidatus Solibacter sp.]